MSGAFSNGPSGFDRLVVINAAVPSRFFCPEKKYNPNCYHNISADDFDRLEDTHRCFGIFLDFNLKSRDSLGDLSIREEQIAISITVSKAFVHIVSDLTLSVQSERQDLESLSLQG